MTTAEERQKILEKVAAGQLSAAEAAAMLATGREESPTEAEAESAMKEDAAQQTSAENSIEVEEMDVASGAPADEASGNSARWLHIRVEGMKTGKRRVTVNIPLRLMKLGMRLGGAFAPELKEIDLAELDQALHSAGKGVLVDVEDEEDGNHVQIYVD